jgi:hypothetical protein
MKDLVDEIGVFIRIQEKDKETKRKRVIHVKRQVIALKNVEKDK